MLVEHIAAKSLIFPFFNWLRPNTELKESEYRIYINQVAILLVSINAAAERTYFARVCTWMQPVSWIYCDLIVSYHDVNQMVAFSD